MRFAEQLLSVVVRDPEHRESILGDLREEHTRKARRIGLERATRWHLRQSAGIAVRYGFFKLLRRKPPVRWIAIAEHDTDGRWWSGLSRDFLYAWRSIAQRPGLSAVVVSTLAIALAANSTTFSLLDALVLRPYRFPGVDRLLIVTTIAPDDQIVDREDTAAPDYREWKQQATTVQQWALYEWWDANLSGVDIPEQVAGFRVEPGYFALLGSPPALGREFVEDEARPGRHHRVVIGHALWQRRFGGDPNIVGKTVRFDLEPYEVVGVAPEGFRIPDGAEVWAPLALTDERWANRRDNHYGAIARLADGQSVEAARAELTTIIDTQRRDHPDTNHNRYAKVMTFTEGMADPGAGAFIAVWQTAALLLLLIACANIANLLLARGAERGQEYAIRLALGANRARLFTQTIIEGLLLSLLAVGIAMPLTSIGLGLSKASIPASVLRFIPGWAFIRIDITLFIATALLGTLAMLVFSCIPAVQAMRARVSNTLRQSARSLTPGRNRQMMRSVLATTQVALALALLFGSTLAITAAERTVNGALGFDKRNVLVANVNLPERTYTDAERRRRFINGVIDQMRTIPAVTDASLTSAIPAGFNNNGRQFFPEGVELKESEARYVNFRRNTPGYFSALRIPLLRGRWFDDSDRLDSVQVAVVSASIAQRYWPDQDPLGKRFKLAANGGWITVIGVCGDVVHNWFTRREETVYRPITQEAPYGGDFAIRTVGDPDAIAGDLRRAVSAIDPDQPIASLTTLEQLVEDRAAGFTFIARALGIVALIALVLSLLGIYSLMAFLTAQRTQEIGVRMALGAGRWQVVRLTTRRALQITIIGTVVGGALAFAVGRLMQAVLFGLIPNNVLVLLPIVAALAVATLLAAYFPARRAASIDPMSALRES
ncbi:MAG TPA: ABC transporter permease [Vicinamibacterales bacterium]|nr:ABC transporter permease [Vicinamibacterales bacterium]